MNKNYRYSIVPVPFVLYGTVKLLGSSLNNQHYTVLYYDIINFVPYALKNRSQIFDDLQWRERRRRYNMLKQRISI